MLSTELFKAIRDFDGHLKKWHDATPESHPEAFPDKAVGSKIADEKIVNQALALINKTFNHDFELDAYRAVLAIDVFRDRLFDWAGKVDQEGEEQDYYPDAREVWKFWDPVVEATKPIRHPLPEPIKELLNLEPPVSQAQICSMYGFLDDKGHPDHRMLEEEKREPGTHFDPKTWVGPTEKKEKERLGKLWEERKQSSFEGFDLDKPVEESNIDRSGWVKPEPASETIEELLRLPGMTDEQVAKMKGIEIEEVREYRTNLGQLNVENVTDAALLHQITNDPKGTNKRYGQMLQAQANQIAGYPELTLIEEIVALSSEGIPVGQIYRAIGDRRGVDFASVNRIYTKRETILEKDIEASLDMEFDESAEKKTAKKATKKKATKKAKTPTPPKKPADTVNSEG